MSLRAILWALHDAPVDDAQAALVLVALAENAHDSGRGAWPAVSTIARKARCSDRTVHRRLRELEESGMIRRGDQRLVDHLDPRYRTVVWDLALHRSRDDRVSPLPGSRGDTGGSPGVTPVADEPSLEPKQTPPTPLPGGVDLGDSPDIPVAGVATPCDNGNMDTTTKRPRRVREAADDDPQWSAFWSVYPRKLSKGAARKAWPRAVAKVEKSGGTAADLAAAASAYADAVRRRVAHEKQQGGLRGRDPMSFVPYPATWLNQERWDDTGETDPDAGGRAPGRTPVKKDEECSIHVGEYARNCRGCAADRLAKD